VSTLFTRFEFEKMMMAESRKKRKISNEICLMPNGNGHIGNGTSKTPEEKITLKRHLGLRNGIGIIVGIIIGSGIFVSPKGVLHEAGSVGGALMIWAGCGLVTLIGALSYAELGASIQKSGGVYSYTQEAFGSLPAFLVLWINSVIRFPTGNTVISLTFSYYIMQGMFQTCHPPDVPVRLLAAAAICKLCIVFFSFFIFICRHCNVCL
jgi:amino acid transporter